ncbi:hypothetical protein GUJ93_ZPchr0010g7436 [Zizania palustris]|uniref:TFIIS N-terminal domain-containing protein n=1 Tax=Zizania palustris TaxID=103762 RepID=A0A8J5SZB1_ZIZPA|nr:hypothetical protein GUJ93_ZPchr0010g7436 [Zizania palustris]
MFWNLKKTVGAPVLIALLVGKAAIDAQNICSADHVSNATVVLRRLHLAKELLKLPPDALRPFTWSKEGLTTLNSWILDSLGKNATQLLRHCVRLLLLVSTDLLVVRLSGIGRTVKEKVCVHTSRDIRAIARQLVSVWVEVFCKEKASNGRLKSLHWMPSTESRLLENIQHGTSKKLENKATKLETRTLQLGLMVARFVPKSNIMISRTPSSRSCLSRRPARVSHRLLKVFSPAIVQATAKHCFLHCHSDDNSAL